MGPDHFRKGSATDTIGTMARFAVEHRFSTILAPAHYLTDPAHSDWLAIDREACLRLRSVLDREGGGHIAIDYPVILPHVTLNDASTRGSIVAALADLPIDNMWVRASGLGPDAGPLTVRRYLSAISALHNLGKPVIADHLGGLVGMAALAFGAVSGVAQGIAERERFDAGSWHKPPPPRSEDAEFGRAVRVAIPGLHRSATLNELAVLASAKNGLRLIACGDRSCCLHGYTDMVSDPRRHAAHQMFTALASLEAVPDLRRETYFLSGPMTDADRLARQVRQLRPSAVEANRRGVDSAALISRFEQHSRRMEQLLSMCEILHQARGDEGPRAGAVQTRSSIERTTKEDRR